MVVEWVLGVKMIKEELGGFEVYVKSGMVDNVVEIEEDVFD